ncbi:hypothetical protein [Lutibacter sp.]|uniref:hypothetical protein n=1 Tax=Lutibacter sp. TaxID=1925666 RepID=UPI0025BB7344|nr:hypothetical protein [Lutibacter sp.]MCF6181097.1 hypothetical protein [Lutibacter sp.]
MKKITFLLVFFAIYACNNKPLNPDRFKHGNFEIPEGKGYSTTFITRTDTLQIEKYDDRIDTLSILWKNNFNYTLKMLHPKNAIDEEPIHVKITSLHNNSYDFEAIIGHSNYIQKGTILIKK